MTLDNEKSSLPYIIIPYENFTLKCLIDTGSSKSFICPEVAEKHFSQFIKEDPLKIKTALGVTKELYSIIIKCPEILKSKTTVKLHIFKFHQYFDCLLGWDIIKGLGAVINAHKKLFITPETSIKLHHENINSECHCATVVEPRSQKIVKLKIKNVSNGTVILPHQKISNLEIPESLVMVKNNEAICSVLNATENEISFDQSREFEAIEVSETEIDSFENLNHFDCTKFKFDLSKVRTEHMNSEEKREMTKLLEEYKDIFHFPDQQLTFTNSTKHHIRLKDEKPVYTKNYRYPFIHKTEVDKQINDMLKQGIIEHSNSPWNSPIWIVPKKLDASNKQKWRIVIDYRKLNEKTIDDRYPLPNITDILDKLGKSQYYTCLDLASGFHQIEMAPADIEKTAFSVDNMHLQFKRMPFGLKGSPSTFQRVMDNILRGIQNEICFVYLDDIIIFSTSLQEHLERLRQVFERIRGANLKIQLDKSEFLRKEVQYLGHVITPDGIKPNPNKISAIENFPIPATKKQLKGFLGLIGYYRKFISNFAKITKPLTFCLKKDNEINTKDENYVKCFNLCKTLLTNEPLLQYPDFEKEFVLTTDASNHAIGAVLSQGPIGSDKPIAYASRTLNEHEINYSTIEKELLAIVFGTKYFRPYIFGRKFTIVTDHRPLQWLFSLKEPNSKLVRWRLKLEEFDYKIIFKVGRLNSNADALSRIPNLNLNETDIPGAPLNNIKIVKGDLFDAPQDFSLAHCVSEDLIMNAGIARTFKEKYNNIKTLVNQNKKIGDVASLALPEKYIYYLITKENYNGKPTYEDLKNSLLTLRQLCLRHNVKNLAMPKISSGLDKLKWEKVFQIIKSTFENCPVNIHIYMLNDEIPETVGNNPAPFFEYMEDFNKKIPTTDENQSMIAEPADDRTDLPEDNITENIPDDNSIPDDLVTVHSDFENPIAEIPISEDPINFGKNQIEFISVKINPLPLAVTRLFGNSKIRYTVQISEENHVEEIKDFLKEYIVPNVNYSCTFSTDKMYEQFSNVVQLHFNDSFKFKKCNKTLTDIEDPDQQTNIVQNYHEGKTNHRGMTETHLKLCERYYWPNQLKTIQNFINQCETCKIVKYDRKPLKIKYNITPTPIKPFEIIHIDVLTYNTSKFLTIVDAFSKYAQAYKLISTQASEIAENLLLYFSHHSVPEILITDNGSEFDNGLVKDFLRLHKIKVHFCSPHHPESNGIIERFHSTILEHVNLINNQQDFNKDDISTKFKYALIAYNNSIHSATRMTPFEILNGHPDPKQTIDMDIEQQMANNYVQNHKNKLSILYKIVNANIANKKDKDIAKANENREEIPVLPKEVFVKSNFRSKLRNRFKPEEIISINPIRKTIRPKIVSNKTGRKFNKLHISNIKRPTKTGSPIPGPSSTSDLDNVTET